jgi:hypothetical protein
MSAEKIGPNIFCGCCVCQGKHCLAYHPGHDHRATTRDVLDVYPSKEEQREVVRLTVNFQCEAHTRAAALAQLRELADEIEQAGIPNKERVRCTMRHCGPVRWEVTGEGAQRVTNE